MLRFGRSLALEWVEQQINLLSLESPSWRSALRRRVVRRGALGLLRPPPLDHNRYH
jgi:hypothetical protein